jgi:opacity protein-like surface antigen
MKAIGFRKEQMETRRCVMLLLTKHFVVARNLSHARRARSIRGHASGQRVPKLVAFLSISLFALLAPRAADAGQPYLGFGVGNARSTVDKESVQFHTQDFSPDVSAWRLLAGYQLTEFIGMEGGYVRLGKARVATSGGDYFQAEETGFELTPVGLVPVRRSLSILARGGLIFWHSDISYHFGESGNGTRKASGNALAAALGAQYVVKKRLGVRGEYSLYAIDKAKAGAGNYHVISLSGLVMF